MLRDDAVQKTVNGNKAAARALVMLHVVANTVAQGGALLSGHVIQGKLFVAGR